MKLRDRLRAVRLALTSAKPEAPYVIDAYTENLEHENADLRLENATLRASLPAHGTSHTLASNTEGDAKADN